MSEYLPYEEEISKRLKDLQLPDEDDSWEGMKRLLEEEDNDRPIAAPPLRGCAGYGLALLVLIILGMLIFDPLKWFHSAKTEAADNVIITRKQHQQDKDKASSHLQELKKMAAANTNSGDTTGLYKSAIIEQGDAANMSVDSVNAVVFKLVKNSKRERSTTDRINQQDQEQYVSGKYNATSINNKPKTVTRNVKEKIAAGSSRSQVSESMDSTSLQAGLMTVQKTDTTERDKISITNAEPVTTGIKKQQADSANPAQNEKADSAKKLNYYFSGGIGLHQLVPVAGQKMTPFNSQGRKGSLGDYIPSVYIRFHKDQKWFLQSGFRYGAPQYTKEVIFEQQTIFDSSLGSITNTSKVKKTFYHQLPISFHYFIFNGFSAGAGVTFNKFTSAVIEQAKYKLDTLISSAVKSKKGVDSNFVNTYLQGMVELQYHRGRFSGGLSYLFGLKPYLVFTLPGGNQQRESNRSLQLFIRYELWKK